VCVLDLSGERATVYGAGEVRVLNGARSDTYAAGDSFPFSALRRG
jgi:hypothetical protein